MVETKTNSRDRGQVILIGAITLAFIVLGIVIVFNGILYTDGLSAGSSSQTATDSEITEAEIRQGISCLLIETNERSAWEDEEEGEDPSESDVEDEITDNIEKFSDSYSGAKSQSTPSVITVEYGDATIVDDDGYEIESVTVTVTYDSQDLNYETELDIEPSDCPRDEP